MSSLNAAALVVGILVVVGGAALWWVFREGSMPAPEHRANERRLLAQRLQNPDFAAMDSFYGGFASPSLVALYDDKRGVLEACFQVLAPDGKKWFVDSFCPADKRSLTPVWPGCEGYFSFAATGSGDTYLVDPRIPDGAVLFYQHETHTKLPVAASLSAFLAFPRKPIADEAG
jgi:hypothetical protein